MRQRVIARRPAAPPSRRTRDRDRDRDRDAQRRHVKRSRSRSVSRDRDREKPRRFSERSRSRSRSTDRSRDRDRRERDRDRGRDRDRYRRDHSPRREPVRRFREPASALFRWAQSLCGFVGRATRATSRRNRLHQCRQLQSASSHSMACYGSSTTMLQMATTTGASYSGVVLL